MRIIHETLLASFRTDRCEWCGRTGGAEGHHYWFKRSQGRLDHPWNLVSLCRGWHHGNWVSCHDLAEATYKKSRHALLTIVAAREQVPKSEIRKELERLRKADKDEIAARASPWNGEALADNQVGRERQRQSVCGCLPASTCRCRRSRLAFDENKWGVL